MSLQSNNQKGFQRGAEILKIVFLILSLTDSGGAERALSTLSSCMVRLGHDVSVLVLSGKGSFYDFDERVNIYYLDLPKLPGGVSFSRIKAALSRALSVRASVRSRSPDCVIGMSHIMSAYAVFSSAFSKIKAVGTERSNPYMLNASRFMTAFRRVTSLLCNGFIFQTEDAQNFFPKSVKKKSAVIPNAVFNELIYELQPPDIRDKTVTAVGRLVECKGFDVLIRAFNAVHISFPEYKLYIYGSGDEKERLLKTVEEEGLSDFVFLPGTLPDVMREVSSSSVFVLSSRYEGMPNALIEAMACGVPCVSTRCRMGPEELIDDGVNGLLVPVDDIGAISSAVIRLLSDKTLSDKLSENSILLRSTLSPKEITSKWIEYLSKL